MSPSIGALIERQITFYVSKMCIISQFLPENLDLVSQIWDSLPRHLARENKKFVLSAVKKGARARAYENALTWLNDADLIHRAIAVETAKHPSMVLGSDQAECLSINDLRQK